MIKTDVKLGKNVTIWNPELVNLYGCTIGDDTKIGTFVEIQQGVIIGSNCKIQTFAYIPEGVTIEDGVFVGPCVCFVNERHPHATNPDGTLQSKKDWIVEKTLVKRGASIGANSTIMCGVTIGEGAMIGAGSVVTKDIPSYTLAYGGPAKVRGSVR